MNIDRDSVVVGESFQLTFKTDENIDAEPDFSALNKLFTILHTRSLNNMQFFNGKSSHSQRWELTVIANKTGILDIPSIRFGNKISKPRSVNVLDAVSNTKSNNADDIFIDIDVSNKFPYVQAQLIYTVKLYLAVDININNSSLSEPRISGAQAVIDRLGEDRRDETRRNGKRYVVIERQYVIFPQSSGTLKIEPLIFQGQIGGGSFFNFYPSGSRPQLIVKHSKLVELEVKPIPDSFIGKTWLPASNLTIQEQWSIDPDKLQQGEATTRTLILRANGLTASHLPPISSNIPDVLKQYPDQPEFEETNNANGHIGIRRDRMAIIPTAAGEYVLPAVKLPWWNTITDKMEVAELPERIIKVDGMPVINTRKSSIDSSDGEGNIQVKEDRTIGESSNDLGIGKKESLSWKLISLLLLILWLATILAWWWNQRQNKTQQIPDVKKVSSNIYLKQLRQACRKNEARHARDALLKWIKSNWPEDNLSGLDAIRKYCNAELRQKLDALNKHLYDNTMEPWNGSDFLKCLESQSFESKQKNESAGKLEPLYKT